VPASNPRPRRADVMGSAIVATATREGTTSRSADAVSAYPAADDSTAAALLDGTGHSDAITEVMQHLACVAARMAARRGALAEILTAGELVLPRHQRRRPHLRVVHRSDSWCCSAEKTRASAGSPSGSTTRAATRYRGDSADHTSCSRLSASSANVRAST
jgi:hypothetical protein